MGAKLERAARIDDVVEHTRTGLGAFWGFVGGALLGLGLVLLIGMTGGAALLLIATVALLGSSIGEFIGKKFKHEAGDVSTGAKTVFIEGPKRNAARVKDQVKCHNEVIISGCKTIYIEGLNATRMTEDTRCAGVLKKDSGARTVWYGGESVQVMPKRWSGEVNPWFLAFREAVGLATLVCGWRALFTDWKSLGRLARVWQVIENAVGSIDTGLTLTELAARGFGNDKLANRIGDIMDHPAYVATVWGVGLGNIGRTVHDARVPRTPDAPSVTVIREPSRIIVPEAPKIITPPRPQIIVPETPRIIVPETPRIIVPQPPKLIVPETPSIIIPSSSYIPPYPGPG